METLKLILACVSTVLVTLTFCLPFFKMAVRDVVQTELDKYEKKEMSKLRWDGHEAEVKEIRLRYDAEIEEIRRRLVFLELATNANHRK